MDLLDFHHHQLARNGIYNLGLDEEIPNTKFSAGLHPKDITENWKTQFEKIKITSFSANCIAIGECGLDSNVAIDDELQNEVFAAHISWAQTVRKPIIIHCVRRFSQILHYKNTKVPLVVHGFNKKENIARELLEAGFYLSFGYAALENLSLQNIIKNIPLQKLFLETDDSDFEIIKLYQKVADLKSISLEKLNQQMWENLENIVTNG
ncbi:MAG: TatD family hydrolase [Weeksellaceae bacterium]|nr:TatD family hydrolase [Weeksellaceae bacterium]